jgi:gliding motility-associated-like protein
MYIEFTTADCVRRGHWGYAYVDVESNCGEALSVNYNCNYPNITVLDAPPGFQTYNWWNQSFSTLLANGEHAVLNPGPPSASTLWLEMIPFNNFGCRDTVKVSISGAFSPTFQSSTNNAPCAPHTITFYNNNQPATQVLWNFGDGTTGIGDTVNHTYLTPGNYQVSMTVTLPNGCVGTTSENVIINQPTGSFNYTGGNFCGNQAITFNANATNATSYTWAFGDGSTITTTQSSITYTYALEGNYVPNVTINFASGCNLLLSGTDSISIDKVDADFTYTVEQFCGYSTLQFTSTSTSMSGIASYSWDFGNGNIGNNATETFTFNSSGARYVKLIVTSLNGCVDSITKLIRIDLWNFPIGNITGPTNGCAGDTIIFNHNFNALDSVTQLQWFSDEGLTSSSNQANFVFNTPGTHLVTLIVVNNHGCSDTLTKSIIIKPIPVFTQPQDLSICNGSTSSPIALSSLYPGGNFSWSNDNTAIGLADSGNWNIPRFTAINSSNSTIQANITLSVIAQGCAYTAPSFIISVQPTPTVNQPTNQTVCNGSLTSAVVFSNPTIPSTTYFWQNNTPSIGLTDSGYGNIAAFTASNTSSNPLNAIISVTPFYNGCAGSPSTFNILVNPTPIVSAPSNQTVCNGAQTNAIQFSVLPSNTAITWTNTQSSIGLLGNGTGNIGSFQAINTTGASVIAQISVTPNFQGCVGNVQSFTIQVNPTPNVIQPQNQQVCNGASTSLIEFNSNITGTIFNWNNNNSNIGMPLNGTGNILPFTTINNTSFSDTAFISVVPVLHGCNGLPKSFFISVSPDINFTAPANQSYCNGQTTSLVNFNLPSNGSSLNWVNNNSSIGLASSGTGNILPFITSNAGNSIATANIIVTSAYLNCPTISHSFNIQVNPNLTIQQPENIEVCPGETINQIQFLGSVSGATYTWSNTNTNIGLAANGVGDIPSFTAINNGLASVNAQITVTGIYNGCNPVQRTFSIIINPSPVINNILDVFVCNGKTTDTIFLNGPNAGTQYSWTNSNPSIGLAPRGIGHIMPFVAINNTTQTQTGLIEIQGETAAHCTALVKVFKIFVNPTPRLMTGNDVTLCRGSNALLSVSGANSYSWFPTNGLSCSNCENPTVTASTSTTYIIEGTNASGCRNRDSIKVNVVQPFDMIVSPNDTVCPGKSIQLNANRATRYQWTPAVGLNNPNIANPIATPSISTMYTVVGFDAMGCFTDTASVYLMIGQNPSVNVGPDISAQTGSIITLNSTVPNGSNVSYNWSPSNHLSCNNCPNPSLTVTGNQMLLLTVQNKYGCTAVDSLYIVTFCKNAQVFVANAFTPDGDGVNDMLIVRGTGITIKSFRVFNRWGNVVFEKQHFQPNDPKYGWNGKVNGVPATPDVYVYIAEVTCDNGTVYFHKGNTTILK